MCKTCKTCRTLWGSRYVHDIDEGISLGQRNRCDGHVCTFATQEDDYDDDDDDVGERQTHLALALRLMACLDYWIAASFQTDHDARIHNTLMQ